MNPGPLILMSQKNTPVREPGWTVPSGTRGAPFSGVLNQWLNTLSGCAGGDIPVAVPVQNGEPEQESSECEAGVVGIPSPGLPVRIGSCPDPVPGDGVTEPA